LKDQAQEKVVDLPNKIVSIITIMNQIKTRKISIRQFKTSNLEVASQRKEGNEKEAYEGHKNW
jgi:hypothetical protein